jgi:hypothetical protein
MRPTPKLEVKISGAFVVEVGKHAPRRQAGGALFQIPEERALRRALKYMIQEAAARMK